jgi:hypothetical protein
MPAGRRKRQRQDYQQMAAQMQDHAKGCYCLISGLCFCYEVQKPLPVQSLAKAAEMPIVEDVNDPTSTQDIPSTRRQRLSP